MSLYVWLTYGCLNKCQSPVRGVSPFFLPIQLGKALSTCAEGTQAQPAATPQWLEPLPEHSREPLAHLGGLLSSAKADFRSQLLFSSPTTEQQLNDLPMYANPKLKKNILLTARGSADELCQELELLQLWNPPAGTVGNPRSNMGSMLAHVLFCKALRCFGVFADPHLSFLRFASIPRHALAPKSMPGNYALHVFAFHNSSS